MSQEPCQQGEIRLDLEKVIVWPAQAKSQCWLAMFNRRAIISLGEMRAEFARPLSRKVITKSFGNLIQFFSVVH